MAAQLAQRAELAGQLLVQPGGVRCQPTIGGAVRHSVTVQRGIVLYCGSQLGPAGGDSSLQLCNDDGLLPVVMLQMLVPGGR